MFLERISILNFKNIAQAELNLDKRINCFVGENGTGKTNLLDAVYYLSLSKSSLTMTDNQCLMHGADFFMLEGDYRTDAARSEKIVCSFRPSGGKSIKRSGKEYERLSDHIGVIPVVIVSPNDTFLINDAADERRRWMNQFLSQLGTTYLSSIIAYNRVLAERNRLLKQLSSAANRELLEVMDAQLVRHGEVVYAARRELVEQLQPLVERYYSVLCGGSESISLSYRSDLNKGNFAQLLVEVRQRDIINQFSTAGIHRDDIRMQIGDYQLRKFGSQGQQKSFLLALKLAQYTLVAEHRNERPVLLLDDLFDKLDSDRLERLMAFTASENFGQIFISDCNRQRLEQVLGRSGTDHSLFTVNAGKIERTI